MVYFDYAATTPPDREINEFAFKKSIENFGNPSSIHVPGKEAKKILEQKRKDISQILGIDEKRIFFTSCASESNNIIYSSFLNRPSRGKILYSGAEHPSSYNPARQLAKFGFEVFSIKLDVNGIIDLDDFKKKLDEKTILVSVIAVSNETGAVQPIAKIRELISETEKKTGRRIHFHSDFVQVAGKIPGNSLYSIPDSFSLSGHKIGTLKGTGLLYSRKEIQPLYTGGGQESGIRPGTENLFGIITLSRALHDRINANIGHVRKLREYLFDKISVIPGRNTLVDDRIYMSDRYVPHIFCTGFHGLTGELVVRTLSSMGYFCSAGSACSSNKKDISETFKFMKKDSRTAETFFRISLHETHSEKEIDGLVNAISEITGKYRI